MQPTWQSSSLAIETETEADQHFSHTVIHNENERFKQMSACVRTLAQLHILKLKPKTQTVTELKIETKEKKTGTI